MGLINTAAKMSAGHFLYEIPLKKEIRQKFEKSNLRIGLVNGTRSEESMWDINLCKESYDNHAPHDAVR